MELAKQLANNYIFRGLPRQAIAGMAAMATVCQFDGGETLVRQFEPSDDLFVILEGSARIRDYHGDMLAEFGPGSVIGEVSLVDQCVRSATVVAAGTVVAAVVPASVIRSMMSQDDSIKATLMANISRVLCMRLRSTNERVSQLAEEPIGVRIRARSA